MKKTLLILFLLAGSFKPLCSQYPQTFISANEKEIILEAPSYIYINFYGTDETDKYDYTIPKWCDEEDLFHRFFGEDVLLSWNEYQTIREGKTKLLGVDMDIYITSNKDAINLSLSCKKNEIDTLALHKKLTMAIESSMLNHDLIWTSLPDKIDSFFSDDLKNEILEFIKVKKFRYPTEAWTSDICEFTVDTKGNGEGRYVDGRIGDDSIVLINLRSIFPVLKLNGKVYPYTISPNYLFEQYFYGSIEKDVRSNAANVTLLDSDQQIYVYDIGYPQMISGHGEYEFGEYYVVKLNQQGKVHSLKIAENYSPSQMQTTYYNNDSVPDLLFSATYGEGVNLWMSNTFIYIDSCLSIDNILYSNQLIKDHYEFSKDYMIDFRENYFAYGLDAPPDAAEEGWIRHIFRQKYNEHQLLIGASKSVTLSSDPEDPKAKKTYSYRYEIYSYFNHRLDYSGDSKVKGEKALKKILKVMDYYKAHPEKLTTDPIYYQ